MTLGLVRDEMGLPSGVPSPKVVTVSAYGGRVAHGSLDAIEKTPHLLVIGVPR
jgi:hypothetical protein